MRESGWLDLNGLSLNVSQPPANDAKQQPHGGNSDNDKNDF